MGILIESGYIVPSHDLPKRLRDAYKGGASPDELREAIPSCWTDPEDPTDGFPKSLWLEMFRRVGFISDTEGVAAPTETLTIYSGTRNPRGEMAWSTDPQVALWFAKRRHLTQHHDAEVWQAEIKPEHVLARFEGRNEHEVVVNFRRLQNVRRASMTVSCDKCDRAVTLDEATEKRVAIHEAGHIIVAHTLEIRIESATIQPGDDYTGCVETRLPLPEDLDPEFDDVWDNPRLLGGAIKEAMVSIAGLEAERLLLGSHDPTRNPLDYWGDVGKSQEMAGMICGGYSEEERDALLRWLTIRTVNLLGQYTWLVSTIADELLRRKTISGRTLRKIIRDAISAKQANWMLERERGREEDEEEESAEELQE